MSKPEDSIDRRQFLRLGGLAGAGVLAVTSPVYAAWPNPDRQTGYPLRHDHRSEKMRGVQGLCRGLQG